MKRLAAILKQRCPRCLEGRVFHGLMSMYPTCGVCGLRYEREVGYFYGAMYASYLFGFVTTSYWMVMLALDVNPFLVVAIPTVHLVLQVPLAFRYSRVIWLHLDHSFDPAPPAVGRPGAPPAP